MKRIIAGSMAGLMSLCLLCSCGKAENQKTDYPKIIENQIETSDKKESTGTDGESGSETEEAAGTAAGIDTETSDGADVETGSETTADPAASDSAASEPAADPAGQGQSDAAASASLTPAEYQGDYRSLPNDAIPFGTSAADRDEKNVPNGVYYYQNLYSKYGADFIRDTSQNVIYLTMDEGYEAGYTPAILDVLKEKNVKATFFITKQFLDANPDLVQRMINEGHVVGNHTCSHPSGGMPQLGADAEAQDIMALHNMVLDQYGYTMKLFRFPEGVFSEQSLALLTSLGYRSVFWSFAYADYYMDNQPDPTEALDKCLTQIHPGAIYLLHAVSSTNCSILGDFIDGARARGFEFGVYPQS